MECCRRRTNLNMLSPLGMNPSLSARVTTHIPAGGTSTSRPKMIAAVVLSPSFLLPAPGPASIHIRASTTYIKSTAELTIDEIASEREQDAWDHCPPAGRQQTILCYYVGVFSKAHYEISVYCNCNTKLYPRMMQASVKKNNGASLVRTMCFRDGVAPMEIPSA